MGLQDHNSTARQDKVAPAETAKTRIIADSGGVSKGGCLAAPSAKNLWELRGIGKPPTLGSPRKVDCPPFPGAKSPSENLVPIGGRDDSTRASYT